MSSLNVRTVCPQERRQSARTTEQICICIDPAARISRFGLNLGALQGATGILGMSVGLLLRKRSNLSGDHPDRAVRTVQVDSAEGPMQAHPMPHCRAFLHAQLALRADSTPRSAISDKIAIRSAEAVRSLDG